MIAAKATYLFVRLLAAASRMIGARSGLLFVLLLPLLWPLRGQADSVVTNCTQDALAVALATGGTVTFTQDCSLPLTDTIPIGGNVTLDSAGRTVSLIGNNTFRLFTVPPGATLTLKGMTLSGGQHTNGGALYVNAGATLVLTNCILAGNHAAGSSGVAGNDGATNNPSNGGNGSNGTPGAPGFGGAIYNLGSLTALTCQFLTNSATGGDGGDGGNGGDGTISGGNGGSGAAGALAYGGCIYNLGTVSLSDCTFSGNTASGGSGGNGGSGGAGAFAGLPGNGGAGAVGAGGVLFSTMNLTAVNSTFSANSSQGGNSAAGGTQSTGNGFAGKKGADSFGGAIYSIGSVFLTDCTFAANSVTGGSGGDGGPGRASGGNGGNGGNGTGGSVLNSNVINVVNCTFSGGSAVGGTNGVAGSGGSASDGTPGKGRGGNVANGAGTFNFTIQASIVSANLSGGNGFGPFVDAGYNISSDKSMALGATSLTNTDPKLGPLADNSGPTKTMALLLGSPAIDKVPPAIGPATDQRGVPRPQGPATDIGAYELVTAPNILTQPTTQTQTIGGSVTFTVQALGDSLAYQWLFNSGVISGATNTSYTFGNADFPDQGNYAVLITNAFGSVLSTNANLRFSPLITLQPTNQTVPTGANVAFFAAATGDDPLSYQWLFNGTNQIPGAAFTNLIVTNAQLGSAGPYTIAVSNLYGAVTSAPAILTVNVAPVITNQPVDQTVVTNSLVTFSVGAIGAQPLRYQWRFNGTGNIAGATAAAYTKTAFLTNNGETFNVVITNGLGSTTSALAKLSVVLPFIISGQISDGSVGVSGVTVKAQVVTNAALTANATSDANGYFTLSSLSSNVYALSLSPSNCYSFSPTNGTPTNFMAKVGPTNATGIDFLALHAPYSLSGTIRQNGTNLLSPVTVMAIGSVAGTNVTVTTNGAYSFTNLCQDSYTIIPSASCFQFSPANRLATVGAGNPNATNLDFVASAFTLGGHVTVGTNGLGLNGVILSASGQAVSSDLTGNYAFSNICSGPYSITPTLPGYRFQPVVLSGTVSATSTGLNFVAFPALTLTLGSNGSVQLAFPALTTSQVEGSTNLQNWKTLFATNNFSANTPVFQFTDTNAPNFRTRFYRVAQTLAGLPLIAASNPALPPIFISAPVTNSQIVASTNLTDWVVLFSTNQTFSNAPFQFTDTNAPNLPIRFYRMSQSPGF